MDQNQYTLFDRRPYGPELTGDANEPWLTRGAITFLDKILDKNMLCLEYGSGMSTVWYASKVKHLISLEHDKEWYKKVYAYLATKYIENVDLLFFDIMTSKEECQKYIEYIHDVYNSDRSYIFNYFDFVSVDGRKRADCIKNAVSHISIGGFLLLDNSERPWYQEAINNYLSSDKWKRYDFDNSIWSTSIWRREK